MWFERQDGSPQSVEFPFFLGGRFAFRSSGATPGSAAAALPRVRSCPAEVVRKADPAQASRVAAFEERGIIKAVALSTSPQ